MKLSDKMSGISSNVNLLRFIAAILVIFCHSFYVANAQEDPFSVFSNAQTNFGGMAVAVFFFLSGFYVTKSLYKNNDAKDFMIKRCIRIFPQLWIVVLVCVLIVGAIFTTLPLSKYFMNISTYRYLLNGFLIPVHNLPGVFENNIYDASINGPLWTMPVEFAAYCVMAIVLIIAKYVLKDTSKQTVFHVLGVLALSVIFVYTDIVINNDFLVTILRPLMLFFIGVLYCDFADKIKLNIPIASVMVVILLVGAKFEFLNYAMMICMPYIIVTFTLITKQIKWNSKLFLLSYEMYLVGWPVQQIIAHFFDGQMNPYLNFVMTIPVDILLAYMIYTFVEKMEKKKNA